MPNIGRVGSGGRGDLKKTENDVEGAIVLNPPQIQARVMNPVGNSAKPQTAATHLQNGAGKVYDRHPLDKA